MLSYSISVEVPLFGPIEQALIPDLAILFTVSIRSKLRMIRYVLFDNNKNTYYITYEKEAYDGLKGIDFDNHE